MILSSFAMPYSETGVAFVLVTFMHADNSVQRPKMNFSEFALYI